MADALTRNQTELLRAVAEAILHPSANKKFIVELFLRGMEQDERNEYDAAMAAMYEQEQEQTERRE